MILKLVMKYLYLVIGLAIMSAVPYANCDWDSQCIDCPPLFGTVGSNNLQYDGEGNQFLAVGVDNLYLLHKNGSTWDLEIVDDSPAIGYGSSMAVNSSGYAHISYIDDFNNALKYARETASGWSIETLNTTRTINSTSLVLDASDYPRIAYADSFTITYAYFDGSWQYETVVTEAEDEMFGWSLLLPGES